MSLLLSRLLRQAETKLAEGDDAEAETLCSQALTGAAALCNTALVAEAATLLNRIPWIDQQTRGAAVLALHNKAVSMQREPIDDEAALKLCDSLLELTPPYPTMHCAVHNMAVFIAARVGVECRQHYIEKLLTLFEGVKLDPQEMAGDIEMTRAQGPRHATAVLATLGAALIRGLFDPADLAALRQAGIAHFELHAGQAVLIDKIGDPTPLLSTPGGVFLAEAIRPFFPVPPTVQTRQTYLRRVAARYPETAVPFHQDVQAFGRLLVNCWTPLTPCGGDAPGLEIVVARLRELTATMPADTQYDTLQISEELVRERFGEDAMRRPDMAPGDVLVLLGTTIHRTHIRPEMTEQRVSLELRFGLE